MSEITTLTVGPLMTSAAEVVAEFGDLVLLVVGAGLGVAFVGFIISKAKSAKRG